ncbi:hypothetical protein [Micromonospora sp. WMMD1082]|uniref:hypothetical protein n=1 Tax=Micromonospora sp. WMMD1082 TaxID=3016104 RepID=UPI00241660D5|nr:hypothetical protein [Micromonospora sp. WMMD1082]MDG4795043.1 hypothetical protein [Micromonospora sp. WMMD1082]
MDGSSPSPLERQFTPGSIGVPQPAYRTALTAIKEMIMTASEPASPPSEPIFMDRYDLPYVERPWGLMYLSPCCLAAVTVFIDDGVLYCKKCYEQVEERLAAVPEPRQPASRPLKNDDRQHKTAAQLD